MSPSGHTFKYGQLTMNCEVRHMRINAHQPNILKDVISFFKHVLPNMEREEIHDTLTERGANCILLLRDAKDVILQRKARCAAEGLKRALLPSVVSWYTPNYPGEGAPPPAGLVIGGSEIGVKSRDEDRTRLGIGNNDDDVESDTDDKQDDEEDGDGEEGGSTEWSESTGDDESEEEEDEFEPLEEDPPDPKENERVGQSTLSALEMSITASDHSSVTFRDRLMAAAAWKPLDTTRSCASGPGRLLQLTLIGSRLKYQGCGLSHAVMRCFQDSGMVGEYSALVTWAGVDAVSWFRRQGFSEDAILNSRYAQYLEAWEDSILMSLTAPIEPPPSEMGGLGGAGYASGQRLDAALERWREQRVAAYSDELFMVEAMKAEIKALREKVLKQDVVISFLTDECARCREQRDEALRSTGHKIAKLPLPKASSPTGAAGARKLTPPKTSLTPTSLLPCSDSEIAEMPSSFMSSVPFGKAVSPSGATAGGLGGREEELENVVRRCVSSMRRSSCLHLVTFGRVKKIDNGIQELAFDSFISNCTELSQGFVASLWIGLGSVDHLVAALTSGNEFLEQLSQDPFGVSRYGVGAYFSANAGKAMQHSWGEGGPREGGFLVLCKVAFGNVETVVKEDSSRTSPSPGYQSIVVPGRPVPKVSRNWLETGEDTVEEFVVFDHRQILPLYCLHIMGDA